MRGPYLAGMVLCAILAWSDLSIAGGGTGGPADAAAIRPVIEPQIDAFRRDDGVAAFGYASPAIQQKFGNPASFMNMVRSGYPQVYRPRQFEFQSLSVEETGPVQEVLVVGPDGVPVMAVYLMQRQPDGSWRIDGCSLTQVPDRSV